MRNTSIFEILTVILTFNESPEEQFYYMKLEVLWILQNLSCVGDTEMMNMFASTFLKPDNEMSEIEDFLESQSAILSTID